MCCRIFVQNFQLEELQSQLHEEIEQKEKLDVKNRQQQQELNSLKSVEKNISKLERSKRKLEDEFNMYKVVTLLCYVLHVH